jgi:pyrimidine operon attenuation protein/uracil phosphoribosyltransferase
VPESAECPVLTTVYQAGRHAVNFVTLFTKDRRQFPVIAGWIDQAMANAASERVIKSFKKQ